MAIKNFILLSMTLFAQLLCLSSTLADQDVFKLGMVVCLTGECSTDGDSTLKGAQLAADEINSEGGILGRKIIFVTQDTAEAVSGAKAISAYRQIRLDPEVHYFIGPSWTPGGLTLAPIVAKERDVIITSPSVGVNEFHEAGDTIFNTRGTDEVATRAIAKVAIERGWRKAAIFSSQQPWESLQGKVFQEEFTKLGGEIVIRVEPLPTITNLSSEVLKIKSSNPDVVFFSNYIQLGLAARELRKLGWHGNKVAVFVDDTRLQDAAGALDGTLFMTFSMPSDQFSKKYSAHYGRRPEIPAGASYDAVYAYAKGIQLAASLDVEKVKSRMLGLRFTGASGEVQFDTKGCVVKKINLWEIRKSQISAVPQ